MQSVYWQHHCTETALLLMQNDLLWSLDQNQCVAMMINDDWSISSFCTVNHSILLHQLQLSECYGIKGYAHTWLKYYLTDRRQFITIKGERSKKQAKFCDVPQGLALCLNLSKDYAASSLGNFFCKHGVLFHIYADDTQIYLPFSPGKEGMHA